jgi:hypothetical protein
MGGMRRRRWVRCRSSSSSSSSKANLDNARQGKEMQRKAKLDNAEQERAGQGTGRCVTRVLGSTSCWPSTRRMSRSLLQRCTISYAHSFHLPNSPLRFYSDSTVRSSLDIQLKIRNETPRLSLSSTVRGYGVPAYVNHDQDHDAQKRKSAPSGLDTALGKDGGNGGDDKQLAEGSFGWSF